MPLMRQALAHFTRVRQLAPDNLAARLWLAQIYLFNRLPDRALEALHDPLTHPRRFGLTETNSTDLNVLASAAYFQKNELPRGVELLELEIARHPDDDTLLTSATQAYFMHGLYTNALRVINRQLARTPDDPQWLFGKGFANLQLGRYDQAITAFTRVLESDHQQSHRPLQPRPRLSRKRPPELTPAPTTPRCNPPTPIRSRSPTASPKSPGASTKPTKPSATTNFTSPTRRPIPPNSKPSANA